MKESVKRGVKCHREKNKHNGEASLVGHKRQTFIFKRNLLIENTK